MSDTNILLVHQIQDRIIEIIRNSKEYCFLITPFFQPWPILQRELEKAAQQEKKIIFILRNTPENHWDFESLNDNFGFDVIFVERLHTKLYLNENECLISSMNLYESSKDNNYELGYYFKNRQQSKNFKETVIDNDILLGHPAILKGRYFTNIDDNTNQNLNKNNPTSFSQKNLEHGFCIRCGDPISLNPANPLCNECFREWANWENYDYEERFCHICRTDFSNSFGATSYNNPVCSDCRKKYVDGYNRYNGDRCRLVNSNPSSW